MDLREGFSHFNGISDLDLSFGFINSIDVVSSNDFINDFRGFIDFVVFVDLKDELNSISLIN